MPTVADATPIPGPADSDLLNSESLDIPTPDFATLPSSPQDPGFIAPVAVAEGQLRADSLARPVAKMARLCGSIIHVDSLALGEAIPLAGTGIKLIYFSDRDPNRRADYQLHVPQTGGAFVPVEIAGRKANPAGGTDLVWDGRDDQGRRPIGKADVTLGDRHTMLGNFKPEYLGLGGWALNVVHYLSISEKRVYYGDGRSREIPTLTLLEGAYRVPDESGQTVDVFDDEGFHLQSRYGLTGAVLYRLTYDSRRRLVALEDPYHQFTRIRHHGTDVVIETPSGRKTALRLNDRGRLIGVVNPADEAYTLSYGADGLLAAFTKPGGETSQFRYDGLGYLLRDAGAEGSTLNLSALLNGADSVSVNMSTAEGRTSTYALNHAGGGYRRDQTDVHGQTNYIELNNDGSETRGDEFSTTVTQTSADARFGDQVQVADHTVTRFAALPNFCA